MGRKRDARVMTHFRPEKQAIARPGDDPITIGIDGSVRINTAKLHSPRNVYDADIAWVVRRRPEFVSLFFAKENVSQPGRLRTRVEIKYPIEPFFHHLWKNSRDFDAAIRKDKFPFNPAPDVSELMRRDAEKDHSEWANFEIIARSGVHACLDFYLLSPSGIARLAMGGGSDWLEATGVLRVYTTTTELRHLFDEGESIASAVESELETIEGKTAEAKS